MVPLSSAFYCGRLGWFPKVKFWELLRSVVVLSLFRAQIPFLVPNKQCQLKDDSSVVLTEDSLLPPYCDDG